MNIERENRLTEQTEFIEDIIDRSETIKELRNGIEELVNRVNILSNNSQVTDIKIAELDERTILKQGQQQQQAPKSIKPFEMLREIIENSISDLPVENILKIKKLQNSNMYNVVIKGEFWIKSFLGHPYSKYFEIHEIYAKNGGKLSIYFDYLDKIEER